MPLRLAFLGTPDFAVPTLAELIAAGHDIVCVYSQPSRPKGRGLETEPSPVHALALTHKIPVRTPVTLKDPAQQELFATLDLDAAIVVAYGLILPKPILAAPRLGCFNLHGSLLPRWRGAAPIQRAVLAGDARTGIMVMQMDEGLDTGPVALAEEMPIGPDMTTGELHDKMMLVGADLMGRALAALERGSLTFTPQTEDGLTYAKKIEKAEARIDWSKPAAEVHNLIRGMSPFPGAWFELELGGVLTRVKALRSTLASSSGAPGTILPDLAIACGGGSVRLTLVQREGKAAMDAATFLRGAGMLPAKAG